jgi:hypothetical protein
LFLASCGSSGPTKKTCTVVKHTYDFLYQVQIDERPISEQWFLYDDAVLVAKDLATKNRCKPL